MLSSVRIARVEETVALNAALLQVERANDAAVVFKQLSRSFILVSVIWFPSLQTLISVLCETSVLLHSLSLYRQTHAERRGHRVIHGLAKICVRAL